MNICADNDYWSSLKWPAAPNEDDYRLFEHYCNGRVLLLGSTKLLLPLATEAWDLHPLYSDPKLKKRDWFSLDERWNTIIIDGALSYGEQFTRDLLNVVLPNCDRFVSRTFLNPNWPTKYAVYFPKAHDLSPVPDENKINDVYSFYIWNNKQS
jgi:hypothetical protein